MRKCNKCYRYFKTYCLQQESVCLKAAPYNAKKINAHDFACILPAFSKKKLSFSQAEFMPKKKKTLFFLNQSNKASLGCLKRIKPHNKHIICMLVGNLLQYGDAEKRNDKTIFIIYVITRNVQYIYNLHNFFVYNGYSSFFKPRLHKLIKLNNQIFFYIKFKTFSFKSLNYLYNSFCDKNNRKKIIYKDIPRLLTLKALAIWFINDGAESICHVKVNIFSFKYKHTLLLQKTIHENFNILPTISYHKHMFDLYFKKKDVKHVYEIMNKLDKNNISYKFILS